MECASLRKVIVALGGGNACVTVDRDGAFFSRGHYADTAQRQMEAPLEFRNVEVIRRGDEQLVFLSAGEGVVDVHAGKARKAGSIDVYSDGTRRRQVPR